jgi:hypothetical protein
MIISYITGEKKFEPLEYRIVGGKQVKGWWIFKKEVEVWYIVNNAGISIGPYDNLQEAQWVLNLARNS